MRNHSRYCISPQIFQTISCIENTTIQHSLTSTHTEGEVDDRRATGERGPHAGLHAPGAETAGRRREDPRGVRPRQQRQLREVY